MNINISKCKLSNKFKVMICIFQIFGEELGVFDLREGCGVHPNQRGGVPPYFKN